MRCVIALGTGCDALPSGIKGVGISFIKEKINNKKMEWHDLLKSYAEKDNIDINVLKVYLDCLIYELGDIVAVFDFFWACVKFSHQQN